MEHKSGFTFKRMKDQMIEALLDDGIKDFRVLDAMSKVCLLYTSDAADD